MATVDILLRTPGGPAAAGPTGAAPPGKGGVGAGKGGKEGAKEKTRSKPISAKKG